MRFKLKNIKNLIKNKHFLLFSSTSSFKIASNPFDRLLLSSPPENIFKNRKINNKGYKKKVDLPDRTDGGVITTRI